MSRPLRPCERRPTSAMLAALRAARRLVSGPQGEPWVWHRSPLVGPACVRRGLADEYRVTPDGQVYYRATPAGLDVAA